MMKRTVTFLLSLALMIGSIPHMVIQALAETTDQEKIGIVEAAPVATSEQNVACLALRYDDHYGISGKKVEILDAGNPTSYQVGYDVEENTVLDTAVVTVEGNMLVATGIGTAKVMIDGQLYEITVTAAPISLLLLAGQSNMQGIDGDPKQSIVCPTGQVYATYADRYQKTVDDMTKFAPSALTGTYSTVNVIGNADGLQKFPVNMLTEAGNGREGMDSGLAYEWVRKTGEKVWVVNLGYGGSSINGWLEGGQHFKACQELFSACQETLRKEIAAGHFTLSHMGYFWCQGCADEIQTAQWYADKFQTMHGLFKKDLTFDHDSDGATVEKSMEFAGIIPIRSGHQGKGSYRAGVYQNSTNVPYYQSFQDLRFNGPRVAQYWMGNNPELTDIWNVCTIQEEWATLPDGTDGVADYFRSAYPNGTVDYTTQIPQSAGWYAPKTPAAVHDNIHYNQIGYNEIGRESARNALIMLGESAAPDVDATVEFKVWDGFTSTDTVVAGTAGNSNTLVVPMVSPVWKSKEVTYTVTDGLRYEYYDLLADSIFTEGTLTVKDANGSVAVIPRSLSSYTWTFDGKNLVNDPEDGDSVNQLIGVAGSISDGQFSNIRYQSSEAVYLLHDQKWALEVQLSDWTGTSGIMMLSGSDDATTGQPYLYFRATDFFVGFGYYDGAKYHNHGVSLVNYGISRTEGTHVYRFVNHIAEDGANMIWLYMDDEKIAPLTNLYLNSTLTETDNNWISGQDFVLSFLGTQSMPLDGCAVDGIRAVERDYDPGRHVHRWSLWETVRAAGPDGPGTEERTCSGCGEVKTRQVDGVWQSYDLAAHMAPMPESYCGDTNLWAQMEHDAYYYHSGERWAIHESGKVYSVTLPVAAGDRIYATSFGKYGENGNTVSTGNGIRLTYFGKDGVLKTLSPDQTYQEFSGNGGYVVVPEGTIAVNVPMWNNSESNELYILNAEHNYESVVTAPTCTEQGYTTYTCICGDSYVDDYTDPRPLNVLMIGNSFSWDAADFWYDMQTSMTYDAMKSMLADPYDVHLAVMYKGSATLAYHATCAMKNTSAYTYTEIGSETNYQWTPSSGTNATNNIGDQLEARDWDIIVIQSYQHEADGTEPRSTYTGGDARFTEPEASVGYLLDYFAEHEPNADVYYYMPWATTKFYGSDTETGYHAMAEYTETTVPNLTGTNSGKSFAGIIPVGTGIQNARTTYFDVLKFSSGTGSTALLKDPQNGLQYDSQHLSFGLGRYIAGIIVAETLISQEMRKDSYVLPTLKDSPAVGELPQEYSVIGQLAAKYALQDPFKLTTLADYDTELADRVCDAIKTADYSAVGIAGEADLQTHVETVVAEKLENMGAAEYSVTIHNFTLENGQIADMEATVTLRVGYTSRSVEIIVTNGMAHPFGEWEVISVPSAEGPGLNRRVCETCGFVEEVEVDGSWQKFALAEHLQELPDDFCGETNLWDLLKPEKLMINHLGEWVSAGSKVYSVTIPVKPGDKIYANSFDQTDGRKGIQVSFIGDYGIVKTTFSSQTYNEFQANGGYLIAPEGAIAVNIPVWNVDADNNTINFLSYDHTYTPAVTAPTCTEQGYTTYTCACGDSYVSDYVEPHSAAKVTDAAIMANSLRPGLTEGSHCSACGAVLEPQEEIPAKGYDWMLEDGEFKILLIGNSFSQDASSCGFGMTESQLYNMLQAMLGEDVKVTLGLLYSGGKGVHWYATQTEQGTKAPSFYTITPEKTVWTSRGGTSTETAITWTDWDVVTLQPYDVNFTKEQEGVPEKYKAETDEKFYPLETATEYMLDFIGTHAPQADVYCYMHWARSSATVASLNASLSTYQKFAAFYPKGLDYLGTETGNRYTGIIPVGLSIQNARTTYLSTLSYNIGAAVDLQNDPQIGLQRDGGHVTYNVGRYIAGLTFAETLIPVGLRAEGYVLPGIRVTESVGKLPEEYTEVAQKAVFAAVESWRKGNLEVTNLEEYAQDPAVSAREELESMTLNLTCGDENTLIAQIREKVLGELPAEFVVEAVAVDVEKNTAVITLRFGYTSVEAEMAYTLTDHNFENGTCTLCGATAPSPYAGKTIACIGDSITYGVGVTRNESDYVTVLAQSLEMEYIRLGASGTTLCTGGHTTCNIGKLTEANLAGADVVTILMGINDFVQARQGYYSLGTIDSTDTSTIYGAAHMWCQRIQELRCTESLKDTEFYFMTPVITSWNNSVSSVRNWDQSKTNIHGYTLRDLCNAIIEVCALYDIPVIDLNLVSGLYYNSQADNTVAEFGGDGAHPGTVGHKMMAEAIENRLLQNHLRKDHDHNYGSWITTTYPNCDDGEQQQVCLICTATERKRLDGKGHTYEDGICTGCGDIQVEITVRGDIAKYTVDGQTVTVTHDKPCAVGYWDEASKRYIALTADANDDSYSFTAPDEATKVLIVIKGNANGDDRVAVSDLAALNAHIRGKKLLTDEAVFAADVNCDGLLDDADMFALSSAILDKSPLAWEVAKIGE